MKNSTQSSALQTSGVSRLRRTLRLCVSLLALTLLVEPAPASTAEVRGDASGEGATAAFQCATLAAIGIEDPVQGPSLGQEVDRLFHYGLEQARASLPEDKAALKKVMGDLGPWHEVGNMSRDFWIGLLYAGASTDMEKLIESKYPAGSFGLFSDLQKAQALAAANEFHKRNCHLIGK